MKKRSILSLLFILFPLVGSFCLASCSNEEENSSISQSSEESIFIDKDLEFILNDDQQSYGVKGVYTTYAKNYNIPAYYNGLPVTDVLYNAFSFKSVQSVTLPDTIERIGKRAFASSSIKSFVFPEKVSIVDKELFYGCSDLVAITLSKNISKIELGGGGAFEMCNSLEIIRVDEDNNYFTSYDKALYDKALETLVLCPFNKKTISFPDSLKHIGDYAFYENAAKEVSITIPEGVTSIGEGAFYDAGFNEIILPESLTSIGDSAFYWCLYLTSINIPQGITSIPRRAFYTNRALTNLTMPDSVTSIGEGAFQGCGALSSINFSNNLVDLGTIAFAQCIALTNIDLPEGLKTIGANAFLSCQGLVSIRVPDSVVSIGDSAFARCSALKTVRLPSGLTSLNNCFLSDDSIEGNNYNNCIYLGNENEPYLYLLKALDIDTISEYVIHEECTLICSYAFEGCSLVESIAIPDSVKYICPYAFKSCSSLKSVYISQGLQTIPANAFCFSSNLEKIVVSADNPYFCSIEGALYSKDKSIFYLCPYAKEGEINLPKEVSSFPEPTSRDRSIFNPFGDCYKLTAINVDSANATFTSYDGVLYDKGCKNLLICPDGKAGTLTMANACESIDQYALYGASKVQSIAISDNYEIVPVIFSYCSSLSNFIVSNSNSRYTAINGVVYSKNKDTLIRCPVAYNNEVFDVPNTTKKIVDNCFGGCTIITTINLPTSIEELAFYFCNRNTQTINYLGTMEQFSNVKIITDLGGWEASMTIHCLDGDVVVHNYSVF